jgi:hypothetical protein
MNEQANQDDIIPRATEIVERFGGIRPMASKLNVPVTTVQGWKKRDAIPAIRRDEILSAAAHYDVDLGGLLNESIANENARANPLSSVPYAGSIAEDPALTGAPRPQAPQPTQPRQRPETTSMDLHDLKQIRATARRTSMLTSVALIAVVTAAGYVLFGGSILSQNRHIVSLETRMNANEAQNRNMNTGGIVRTVSELQVQMNNIAGVIGTVATGAGSISDRLATIEQQMNLAGVPTPPNIGQIVDNATASLQTPQGRADWQPAIEDLRNIVTDLQGRTDQLDNALVQAKSENDALGRTLSDVSGRDLQAAAMLLALTQLRESADRQTPFAEDLALLREVSAGNDPELAASIDKLAPYAATGVMSPAGLKRELQASANDIITAKLNGEDVSFKEKIMGRLKSLFSIRKDGVAVAGGEERALIDQASAQLDRGDIAGARATLAQLDGASAQAAGAWQSKADATLAAQALDMQLVKTIAAKIKATVSGVPAPIDMSPAVPVAPEAALDQTPSEPAPAPAPAPEQAAPVIIQQ